MPPAVYDPDFYSHSPSAPIKPVPAAMFTITLTSASNPKDIRKLQVSHGKRISVGRASRVEVKNLQAGAENALFDCPVVSRMHAEITANPWALPVDRIQIIDKDSMHGTSVNGQPLKPFIPFSLKSGDLVKFGVKVVTRGEGAWRAGPRLSFEQFTDTTTDAHDGVVVIYHHTATGVTSADARPAVYKSRSYEVPDDSDVESDYGESSSPVNEDDFPSSAHTTPEKAAAKLGSQYSPIDLESTRHAVIDLVDDEDEDDSPVFATALTQTAAVEAEPSSFHSSDASFKRGVAVSTAAAAIAIKASVIKDTYDEEGDVEDFFRNGFGSGQKRGVDKVMGPYSGIDEEDNVDADKLSEKSFDYLSDSDASDLSHHQYDAINDVDEVTSECSFASNASDASDASHAAADLSENEDEGPEILSSKRAASPELGTPYAGQSAFLLSEPASTTKQRYDPVRGSQQPADSTSLPTQSRARAYTYGTNAFDTVFPATTTNFDTSSRWDMPPPPSSSSASFYDNHAMPPAPQPSSRALYDYSGPFKFTPCPSFDSTVFSAADYANPTYFPSAASEMTTTTRAAHSYPAPKVSARAYWEESEQNEDVERAFAYKESALDRAVEQQVAAAFAAKPAEKSPSLARISIDELVAPAAATSIPQTAAEPAATANLKRKADAMSIEPGRLTARVEALKVHVKRVKMTQPPKPRLSRGEVVKGAAKTMAKFAAVAVAGGVGAVALLASPLAERVLGML